MASPVPRTIVEGDSTIIFFPNGTVNICAKHKSVGSPGIWNGDNPISFVLPITLLQITFGVIISQILYILLRPLKTPKFVCRVLGGIILGPSSFGTNVNGLMHTLYPPRQAEFLFTMALIAFAYFIFLVALQMDIKTTLKAAKSTWRFGVVPFLSSVASLSSLSYMYGDKLFPLLTANIPRTFFCGTLSFSNFVVLSEYVTELKLASSELGKIALCSAMLNDVMQWFTLLLMSFFKPDVFNHSLQFLVCYWLLIFACVFVIRPIMFQIVKSTPVGKPVKEVYVVCILAGVLIVASLAETIGLSSYHGALLLGLVMPNGPPLGTTIVQKTQVVLSQFFLPLFFLFIGSNVNIHELKNWHTISMLQWIIVVGYGVKILACILVALSYNMRPKHGLVMGLILNMKGIIELITFTRMKRVKLIDEQVYTHLVFSILLMTAIISPLIEWLYKPHARLDRSPMGGAKLCTIQDTSKNTEFGIICCVYKDGNVESIVAFLEACNPTIESPIFSHVVHFAELLGKSTPFLLPVKKQKRKSLSKNYPNTHHIMRAFENYAHDSEGRVKVQPYINVAPYKHMHEAVCRLAQDNSIPLLIIPFHENGQTVSGYTNSNFRELNSSFQKFAPCTVGILVDRQSQLSTMRNTECCRWGLHVGIFFIGGPDDREALSLGIRMTEDNEHTKVTLLWMVMKNKNNSDEELVEEDEEVEKMLNEGLIDEFKAKSIESDKVRYEEVVVEDGIGVLEAIRGMEGNNYNYDLVMVGRRHNLVKLDDVEMSNFMENVETLGIVGDMLSSSEFGKGKVPVLVTQCGGRRYWRGFNRYGSASQFNNFASRSLRP